MVFFDREIAVEEIFTDVLRQQHKTMHYIIIDAINKLSIRPVRPIQMVQVTPYE